jgi:hypothetical protein
MIERVEAGHEQAKNAPGAEFFDSVSIDFSDPDRQLFGLGWMTRLPNAGRFHGNLVLFAAGELAEHIQIETDRPFDDWANASVDGVRMTTERPLEHWSLAASGNETSVELNVESVTGPRVPTDQALLEKVGIDQYEQLCNVSGTVSALGRTHEVSCFGRRVHCWGTFAWGDFQRWRALHATAASGRAISVLAAQPVGSDGHGDELRTAQLLDEEEPQQFLDVYLSTVYDAERMPTKAGLELWETDEEIPRRFGGEAICAMRAQRLGHELIVSFFRWSIDGELAYGCYEVASK